MCKIRVLNYHSWYKITTAGYCSYTMEKAFDPPMRHDTNKAIPQFECNILVITQVKSKAEDTGDNRIYVFKTVCMLINY